MIEEENYVIIIIGIHEPQIGRVVMHSEYGVVLDYFYICEIGLDCSIQRFEAFGLTFYYGRVINRTVKLSAMLDWII